MSRPGKHFFEIQTLEHTDNCGVKNLYTRFARKHVTERESRSYAGSRVDATFHLEALLLIIHISQKRGCLNEKKSFIKLNQ